MNQPDFNPFDPISAAMGAMHGQNLLAAKDARIKQLEAEVERLRKAGDAVCESPYAWETDPAVIEWRAAKDGNANG